MQKMRWLSFLFLLFVMVQCRRINRSQLATSAPTASPSSTPRIGVSLVTRAAPTTAVLPITPAPLPTDTPTPTATPIIYVVVEGDTLLGIAIQEGTTVEAIQAMNPGVRPELLQIGQQLLLPPPATPDLPGVAGTAVPIQVDVVDVAAYRTPLNGLWLLGEVVNWGQQPAANVQISLGLLDATGQELGTAAAWAAAPVILPGETAPFGVLVGEVPAGFAQPSAGVRGGEVVLDLGLWYLDLAVVDTAVIDDGEQVHVSGHVQNNGLDTAVRISLTATFYNDLNQVTGYQQQDFVEPLAPTATMPFSLTAAPPGGQTNEVNIVVWAVKAGEDDG